MGEYAVLLVIALLGALAVSAALTPLVRYIAVRWGAIDEPNARKIHLSPIPRLGGLAIWIALWSVALATVQLLPSYNRFAPTSTLPELTSIFAAATVILG